MLEKVVFGEIKENNLVARHENFLMVSDTYFADNFQIIFEN